MGYRTRVVASAVVAVAAVGCGGGTGEMACSEFRELSAGEQQDTFDDAVEDRGVSFGGPDWQAEMRVAMASGHCQQRPDDTLDDALDFVGIPQ